jgi:predicted SprT family Zn-dependent metalloprotease
MYKKWTIADIQQVLKETGDKMGMSTEGVPIVISNRMTKTMGQYTSNSRTFKPIKFTFAKILLSGIYPKNVVKDTIIHEYCHFYTNSYYKKICNHDYRFKTTCRKAGIDDETYFTYNSETVSNMKEKTSKYILKCVNCGHKYYRDRVSKLITDIEDYRCAECGGRLKRIK